MSKEKVLDKKVSDNHVAEVFDGKTTEELEEILKSLEVQATEYQKQYNNSQTMLTKAQGAMEVIAQLIKKDDDDS